MCVRLKGSEEVERGERRVIRREGQMEKILNLLEGRKKEKAKRKKGSGGQKG